MCRRRRLWQNSSRSLTQTKQNNLNLFLLPDEEMHTLTWNAINSAKPKYHATLVKDFLSKHAKHLDKGSHTFSAMSEHARQASTTSRAASLCCSADLGRGCGQQSKKLHANAENNSDKLPGGKACTSSSYCQPSSTTKTGRLRYLLHGQSERQESKFLNGVSVCHFQREAPDTVAGTECLQ